MTVQTDHVRNQTNIDRLAASTADRLAEKYGLRDRARNTFRSMSSELLKEVQGAIQANAQAEAKSSERARLREALDLPEADGRRDLAESLALDTDAPIDQIKAILTRSPKQHRGGFLDAAMKGLSPGLSDDDGSDGQPLDAKGEAVNAVLNAR